ncbi:hypothetical protein PLICRDRAFT_646643 [Plicaturopsis crispa FD-325 SS-3]|nr:hypothetical protein PLICRDRAFT_646643 [Plicaturopsis crispa FD-325 SS-3]
MTTRRAPPFTPYISKPFAPTPRPLALRLLVFSLAAQFASHDALPSLSYYASDEFHSSHVSRVRRVSVLPLAARDASHDALPSLSYASHKSHSSQVYSS